MERIFNQSNSLTRTGAMPSDDEGTYEAFIKAMIDDAVDYEDSYLGPIREQNQAYYYGELPKLMLDEDETEEDVQQSTSVSTDVRDTVMAIMPTLMRTLAGGATHVVTYVANKAEDVEAAQQATEYIHQKFWEDNGGFLLLHGVIKDCLTVKVGVITWYTDTSYEVKVQEFSNISEEQIKGLMERAEVAGMEPTIVEQGQPNQFGLIDRIVVQYISSKPELKIEAVPPDEFRISRRAKTVKDADLVGRQTILRASDLISKGYDADLVLEHAGASVDYSAERSLRNGYADQYDVLGDLVIYGEYFIRIDSDGDGINELHLIKTIGDDNYIIDDEIVSRPRYALFQSDPRSHTAIGDCPADLVLEIQDIKTNILRGSLDSLADVLNPRLGINETLVNMGDALSTDRGAIIRTKGMPKELIQPITTEFVGGIGFEMMDQIDKVRQSRTGISEASKGMDPKALQSTNVMGVDAIVTGAQERIELIARILAETGLKDLFVGLLQEVTDNPNPPEVLEIRGKYVTFDPSLFPTNLKCRVNPSLGKGNDALRFQTLSGIRDTQVMIMEKYGFDNPVVGIQEFLNTTEDMLSLVNVRNMARYFKPVTPEQLQAIAAAPKEPTPEQMIAEAEVEKNKKDVVIEMSKADRANRKMEMDDDFRRDKLNVDSVIAIASIFKDMEIAREAAQRDIQSANQADR